MVAERVFALERGLDLVAEGAVGVEARDLVLVLVGQELEVVPRHRERQRLRPGNTIAFERGDAVDKAEVALGVGAVLVGGEEGGAPGKNVFEAARRRLGRRDRGGLGGRAFDRGRLNRRPPAPAERA